MYHSTRWGIFDSEKNPPIPHRVDWRIDQPGEVAPSRLAPSGGADYPDHPRSNRFDRAQGARRGLCPLGAGTTRPGLCAEDGGRGRPPPDGEHCEELGGGQGTIHEGQVDDHCAFLPGPASVPGDCYSSGVSGVKGRFCYSLRAGQPSC